MPKLSSTQELDVFLARYETDRNYELELEKVTAQYELGFIQAAGILNGASSAAYISFLAATLGKIEANAWLLSVTFGAWLLGLVAAVIGGLIAYKAQTTFGRAIRFRRHAAGPDDLGRAVQTHFQLGAR